MENDEKEFFNDFKVLITQSRFVCNGKTYAMRNISSVSMGKIEGKYSFPVIFIFLAFLIAGLANYTMFGVIILIFFVAYLYFGKSDDKYIIKINSNSGEVNALESNDKEYIEEVEKALNNAIIFRG